MIMTRSGFIGMQRYGAGTWSGDITASWETLGNQIPAVAAQNGTYRLCHHDTEHHDAYPIKNDTQQMATKKLSFLAAEIIN